MRRSPKPTPYITTARLSPFLGALLNEIATDESTSTNAIIRRALLSYCAERIGEETWDRLAVENGADDDERKQARHTVTRAQAFERGKQTRSDDLRAELSALAKRVDALTAVVEKLAAERKPRTRKR